MTSISKNVYTDKLDDITKYLNKYNNTYHRAIEMKRVDVKSSTYIDFNKENNKKGPKFKFCAHVRISKYKKFFAKGYVRNWSEIFVNKKFKNKNFISELHGEEIVGTFYEKELQKTNRMSLELKK